MPTTSTTLHPANQTTVAWITGASQGIGRALALAILRGLRSSRFEIRFPFLFAGIIGLLRILPYRLYFWLIRRLY